MWMSQCIGVIRNVVVVFFVTPKDGVSGKTEIIIRGNKVSHLQDVVYLINIAL